MIKLFYMKNHFKNKKVLITGHNGFKGTWLSLIMIFFGAKVIGCGLKKKNDTKFFKFLSDKLYKSHYINICEYNKFSKIINTEKPEFIFHLAAQALVFDSYKSPEYTFKNNIISSINLLEILRKYKKKVSVVFITSDKVYKNIEKLSGYNENSILGGEDPYSASKSSIEIILNAYIKSYFLKSNKIKISIARAGNVIGGGDWSKNRVIPDLIKSYFNKKKFLIRNPKSERPWQHVLDPLVGYILIIINLNNGKLDNGEIFNFGPTKKNTVNVGKLSLILGKELRKNNGYKLKLEKNKSNLKETNILRLDSTKAKRLLNWKCNLNINNSLKFTSDWYTFYYKNKSKNKILDYSISQIQIYFDKYYENSNK